MDCDMSNAPFLSWPILPQQLHSILKAVSNIWICRSDFWKQNFGLTEQERITEKENKQKTCLLVITS